MADSSRKGGARTRREARRRALQALYQWQVGGQDIGVIEKQFLEDEEMHMELVDQDYFHELLHEIPAHLDRWDGQLSPFLDRAVESLDPVERAILRLGVYELNERLDVPYRVVITEAVELAKSFGAEASHKYINGVLDKVGRGNAMRAAEIGKA